MEEESTAKEEEERVAAGEGETRNDVRSAAAADISRKEKRKERKKLKRRQLRREIAEKEREEEEANLNDPEEQRRALELEEQEKQRMERERKEFEERERKWLEEMEKKRKEEEMRRAQEEEEELKRLQAEKEDGCNEDDDWEYVEGPAEIIWKGNEITVRKKKVKVRKKNADQKSRDEASERPTSNPLPPQTEAFVMASAEQLLENVAQQVPNFGTEQDKAHCPFHLKTGACRFGQRCSRVHFYPDKACTLLMKNMYNGPGLAREQDEGLEYTDEEVERSYEEFYEDVHTEFLKYGEIVNFKVCKNSSSHLRGNVYVQYKSLDSAVLAYHSFNGRYFAGKQVQCEYVNVTRWKVAICGEYMKSRLKECSRGSACNFIHCFRNPGGDYEWADWDKPPPRYWVKEMAGLFGFSYDSEVMDREETENLRKSKRKITPDSDRFHKTRSRSRDIDRSPPSGRSSKAKYHSHDGSHRCRSIDDDRKGFKNLDEKSHGEDNRHRYHRNQVSHSDRGLSDKKSEPFPDLPERKIKGWDYDSDEFSEENRKHHSHMERKSRHQGRKRSVDNCEDVKESDRKKEERRVHSRKKSSRHRSSSLDDYNGTHDTDDSDSSERHQSHKRRRARKSDEDASDEEVFDGKRLEMSYSSEDTETGKSKSRREKSGRGTRDRSRSIGRSVERNSDVDRVRTRENRCGSVGHYSGHDHTEEDRWKPDSPNREQTSP